MLPDYPQLILFLTATLILNLTPGSDVLYIASQSLVNRKQGILATFGTSTGIGIYVIATAFGLSEVFHHLPWLFNAIKLLGAAYLLYLAWKAFFSTQVLTVADSPNKRSLWKAYSTGIFINLSNPKIGLFFITFLPQFTDSSRGKIWLQLLSLGGCFIVSGTIVNILYTLLFAHTKDFLFKKSALHRWLNKATAVIFCGLALKVLTARQY